jgi:hypothetical protein
MNEDELDDAEMVVGMPKVHVLNTKTYLVDPSMQTMQKPQSWVSANDCSTKTITTRRDNPMVRMQVICHVGFSDLVLLYSILKWCLQPCFRKHSN